MSSVESSLGNIFLPSWEIFFSSWEMVKTLDHQQISNIQADPVLHGKSIMKLQRNYGDLFVLSKIPNEKGSHLKIFPNEKAYDISFDETFCKEHYLTNDGQSRKHVIVIKIY